MQVGNYTVDDQRSFGKSQYKTTCPVCPERGKKNTKDKCLSVNMDKQVVNCHKCGWSAFFGEKVIEKKEYKPVERKNFTELTDEHLKYFGSRRITPEVLRRNKVATAKNDWIAFPYYEGETLANVKYRKSKDKAFMQEAGAKPTMYKYNDIVGQKKIIITEGEIDALSWEVAGFGFATSVNQGAPNVQDKNIEKKLECVYNCFDVFEQAEVIYLSVDKDPNGQRLQKELIKIFRAEKIKIIDHGDCKDANEVLMKHGYKMLHEQFDNAREVKVEGIFDCSDFEYEILKDYREGQPVGTTTYFAGVDACWRHRKGEVTIWTGYNNEGKSLFLKQLLLLKSKFDGWKHAFYSPEEMPYSEWYTDLIESYIGKSADLQQKRFNNYMTEFQLVEGMKFMQDHFYVVYPEEGQTLDQLLERFSYLVRKNNVQTVTIDPYNQVQHDMLPGEREDLYISRFMSKLKKFAVKHDVALHLVAHQITPDFKSTENYPKPNLYKVKGGGTFADKADNVVIVWREHRNTDIRNTSVKFISQKIKKQKLTGIPGFTELNFDRNKNRYFENERSPFDMTEGHEVPMFTHEHIDDTDQFGNDSLPF